MKLFSYVVTHDTGFAPNPFFGCCTLACCKPAIRRDAAVGDWVVGLTPKALDNYIVFGMEVEEKLAFKEYWKDSRFAAKKPNYRTGREVDRHGDNIYEPRLFGFRQLRSAHSNDCSENGETKQHDLGGKYVLVSRSFVYFGSAAIALPHGCEDLIVGRAHKCRFPPEVVNAFSNWISEQEVGVRASPRTWPAGDTSWQT